jgi:hypothetical protein
MRPYTPRRQSKRWLDGDCPDGVLAIYYDKREWLDPYTIFYTEVLCPGTNRPSLVYVGSSAGGSYFHGELLTYQVAEYRALNSRRACKWTDLPEPVRRVVLKDLEASRMR